MRYIKFLFAQNQLVLRAIAELFIAPSTNCV